MKERAKMSNRADYLNKERWDQQRSMTMNTKLDRIILLLEKLLGDEEE